MTELGYYVSDGEHQDLTDFLQAIAKGSLTKARMAELAQAHLDQHKAHRAETAAKKVRVPSRAKETGDQTASEVPHPITVIETDGTLRTFVYDNSQYDVPPAWRPSPDEPDRHALAISDGARARRNKDGIVLALQGVSGVTGPVERIIARLWEVRECVDALRRLPSKAGTRDALARVVELRAGLVKCQGYCNVVTDTLGADEDDECQFVVGCARELWEEIETLTKPPAPA